MSLPLQFAKRSMAFNNQMCELAMKIMGVSNAHERKQAAQMLTENTTDNMCMLKAKSEEPVFVLRAKDPMAAGALAQWIADSVNARLHADKIDQAKEVLKAFKAYQVPQVPR